MTLNLQFTPKDWERIKRDWTAWWDHDLRRSMVVAYGGGHPVTDFIPQFGGWDIKQGIYPLNKVLGQYQKNIEATQFYGDAWPGWWPNFGAGVVAAFLGSGVDVGEDTIWFDPIVDLANTNLPLQDIRPQYAPDNFWWRWVKTLIRAAIKRWGGQIVPGIRQP